MRADFLNFSLCMRKHGVSNFPDPSSQGGIQLGPGSANINPGSPVVQSAQRQCKHLLPGGGPPAELSEQQKLQAFRFASCMRAHGVPNYPDPVFQGPVIVHNYSQDGINPASPAFQKAAGSCGNPI